MLGQLKIYNTNYNPYYAIFLLLSQSHYEIQLEGACPYLAKKKQLKVRVKVNFQLPNNIFDFISVLLLQFCSTT